jgi:hypothetical protein
LAARFDLLSAFDRTLETPEFFTDLGRVFPRFREPLPFAIADRMPDLALRAASSSCRCKVPIIRPSDSAERISSDSSSRGFRARSTLPCLAIPSTSSKERVEAFW